MAAGSALFGFRESVIIFVRCLVHIVLAAALAVGAVDVSAQGSAPAENRLKAAVVSKFPQFVEWPAAAIDSRATVDLCVASPDPYGGELDALVAGNQVGGRPLVVRRVAGELALDGCQLLLIPSGADHAPQMLARAATLPILTVGDSPHFLDEGGIVCLRVVEGRVRFDIDAPAARRAGLRISAQLLRLALQVRGGHR